MNKYWTTDPTVCLEPHMTYGSGTYQPYTVIEKFHDQVAKRGSSGALYLKRKGADVSICLELCY